jgi:hypothetical protein
LDFVGRTLNNFEVRSMEFTTAIPHRPPESGVKPFHGSAGCSGFSLDILVSKGDEKSLSEAAAFMVDAFWLSTGRLLIPIQDDSLRRRQTRTAP